MSSLSTHGCKAVSGGGGGGGSNSKKTKTNFKSYRDSFFSFFLFLSLNITKPTNKMGLWIVINPLYCTLLDAVFEQI